jgi:hypothetical protein
MHSGMMGKVSTDSVPYISVGQIIDRPVAGFLRCKNTSMITA